MKCPHCGHWNQASFPRCFQCGEPLLPKDKPNWQAQLQTPKQDVRIIVNDAGDPTALQKSAEQPAESLPEEMQRLKDRRQRGTDLLQNLRETATQQGILPSGGAVQTERRTYFENLPDDPEETLRLVPEHTFVNTYDRILGKDQPMGSLPMDDQDDIPPAPYASASITPSYQRRKRQRVPIALSLVNWTVRLLAIVVVVFGAWQAVLFFNGLGIGSAPATVKADVTIEAEEIDGLPGHIVYILGEEGSKITVAELLRSYVVIGGVARIPVPDHIFYDSIARLEAAQMDVTLTPTLSRGGVETRLTPIAYTIDIPLSPLEVLAPEAEWVQVSKSIASIRLKVEPSSRVVINGTDVSDTVTDEGVVTFNPTVQAIGDNIVTITVRAPYCRERNQTIIFYRPVQEIPLELAADAIMATDTKTTRFYATTQVGATITLDTPFDSIDTAKLGTTGEFSFVAIMAKVGYNTIQLRASFPGKADSTLEHTIYYLPPPNDYTKKAWALSTTDYSDLLANIALRVKNAQIYRCLGEITEILADKPQLAVMNTGTAAKPQYVLIQNESRTTFVVGNTYRVYADVSGMYGDWPKLIGRYTYID